MFSLSAPESEHEVDGAFLLDVVVSEASAVFEALATEDQSLLVSGDTLLVLDLSLHSLNGVSSFGVDSDGLACKSPDEDLVCTTSKSEDEMNSALFGDVIVAEGSGAFELFSSEDQSLAVSWDSFFVLDFGLDGFNAVTSFDIKGDGLAGKGSNEDLHLLLWFVEVVVLVIIISKDK